MRWWALRLGLFVLVVPALLFWGLLLAPWLGYFLPAAALLVFVVLERRSEHWLRHQIDP